MPSISKGRRKQNTSSEKDNSALKSTTSSSLVESLFGNNTSGQLNGSTRRSLRKSLPNQPDSQETNPEYESEDDISKDEEIQELKLAQVNEKHILVNNANEKYGAKGKNIIALEKITPEELEEHYKQCIGLFSKNKVNTKNAFSLQLIDFMKLMMDRKTDQSDNLTVMSCTLDASAKIYSCRVDNVYTTIQKFVNSYNNAKSKDNEKKINDDDDDRASDEAASDAEDNQNNKKKKKSKLLKDRKRFLKDIESLNRKEIEVCYYRQNLPKNQSYFLESSVSDEGHELTLNRPLFPKYNSQKSNNSTFTVDKIWNIDVIPSDNFEDKIPGYKEIRNKLFIGDDRPEDEVLHITENEFTFDPDVGNIAEMKNFHEIGDEQSEHGDDENGQDIEIDYDDCDESINEDKTILENTKDSLPASISLPPTPQVSFTPVAMSRMLRISNKLSDYSYFDSSKLDFMPSATHWKIKPSKRPISTVGKTPGKSRKTKQIYLNFSHKDNISDIEALEEDDSISHKLHVKTIKDWYTKRHDLIFAPIIPNVRKKLLCLFKDNSMSILSLVKTSETESTEYNANESVLLNPHEFTSQHNQDDEDNDHRDDAGGDYHPEEDWRDNDYDQPNPIDQVNDDQSDLSQNLVDKPVTFLDSLVPAPNRVEKVTVTYAKTQKRIDIKKLKSAIWTLLDFNNADTENKENEKNVGKSEKKKEIKFSTIFKKIPDSISKEAAAELSYPIGFMAILHMANEKSLKLTPIDNYQRDFTVSLDSPPNIK